MSSDFIIAPDALTTVHSAVNAMLGSIGEGHVSTIDPVPTGEVSDALSHLQLTDNLVQSKGWSWNKEYNLKLALDGDGKVPLPDMTLKVTAAYYTSRGFLNVVQRGPWLYDLTNHTYVFETAPYVDIVSRLSWDLLPQAARTYILYKAMQIFQAGYQDRPLMVRITGDQVASALVALEQNEDENAPLNSITGNISALNALGFGIRRRGQI